MSVVHKPSPSGPRIGIDLGGTKTEIIVLSENGETMMRQRVATPSHDYGQIVQTIAGLVTQARQCSGPVPHIGIGIPGASDATSGLIKNANTTCLIGQPLAHDLANLLRLPVKLENDANCFTLSEAMDGSGAGHGVVFGVILGTGVGAGWCFNGQLHPGMHHIGGEWGHNPIPLRLPSATKSQTLANHPSENNDDDRYAWAEPFIALGRDCYCGKVDCVETHLSGKGLATTHAALCDSSTISHSGTCKHRPTRRTLWSVEAIAQAATHGDVLCQQALALYARQLANALANIINIIDPDVIVLGGGLSNLEAVYPLVQAAVPEFVFNNRVMTPIVKARHGDSSGVRGAAWL